MNVEYAQHSDVKNLLTQLMNFLYSQDISKNVLSRIYDDYSELYEKTKPLDDQSLKRRKKKLLKPYSHQIYKVHSDIF